MSVISMKRMTPDEVPKLRRDPVDPKAREIATDIVTAVRERGLAALLEYAVKLGDLPDDKAKYIYHKTDLKAAFEGLSEAEQSLITRTADRINHFAKVQRGAITEVDTAIPGGRAGHTVSAVETAGCYAPGGRYPLPSSVLMTACTARAAGCKNVWVASPRPSQVTLGAAYVADADALLAVGGAHAIAALAYGAGEVPACDAVVGPGNAFVTAAKSLVAGRVAIDMLAGPSECLVFADETGDAAVIAADLLAQAEHDVQALPILVTTSAPLVDAVDAEINKQLATLTTAAVARDAMAAAFAVVVPDEATGVEICDRLAPEHLELHLKNSDEVAKKVQHYGGLFVGHAAAEVLGDYGAGPNHTLPTGGTARSNGGLSVMTFLRVRTWMRIDSLADAQGLIQDSVALGRTEGLEGHARAAELRLLK